MKQPIEALLFDLNGTMINDMEYHMDAWFRMLNEDLGAGLSREEVRSQMYGSNIELFIRVFGKGHFSQEEMQRLSLEKERRYQQAYRSHLRLIPGLFEFLEKSHRKDLKMAIVSAAIPFNIDFVLDNLDIRKYFSAIVSAEDVTRSKPDPESYLKAAALLGRDPPRCLVFEDAPKGAESARNAGMSCIVLKTLHEPREFENHSNILRFIHDYTDPFLQSLL